jgi:hypothetical protein
MSMTSSRVSIGLASGSTVPRTTTLSDKLATCRVATMLAGLPAEATTLKLKDSNPDFSTATICGPGCTSLKTNWPSCPVVVWVALLVVRFVRVTAALATVAPEESTTFPLMTAAFWARPAEGSRLQPMRMRANMILRTIPGLLQSEVFVNNPRTRTDRPWRVMAKGSRRTERRKKHTTRSAMRGVLIVRGIELSPAVRAGDREGGGRRSDTARRVAGRRLALGALAAESD